jgi:SAM-dependent methyltransferase
MTLTNEDPVAIQREYYTMVEPRTLLDVGCGTGRGIRYLCGRFPSLRAVGVEPVRALLEQGVQKGRITAGTTVQGSGYTLPFADASIDVVCSFAILHHVKKPNEVVREMLRVARKAVLIADSNRFGQGRAPVRLFKLAAYKLGLWGIVNYLKTGGKGYLITEGDGLAYSYSVYDSFDCLASGSSRLLVLPAEPGKPGSWFHPLLTSSGVIALAIKGVD